MFHGQGNYNASRAVYEGCYEDDIIHGVDICVLRDLRHIVPSCKDYNIHYRLAPSLSTAKSKIEFIHAL